MDLAGKLRQTATYWAPSGSTDRYGKPTLAAPVQVSCRWEDKTSAVISKKGEEIISKSRVYLIQDIDIDGFLFLGTSASTDPASIDDAHEIQAVSKTPDLSNLQSLTTVYL